MKTKVKVQKIKGDRKAQRAIKSMTKKGYTVQSQNTRKAVWGLGLGLFTRTQIHTITFIKEIG